MAKIAPMNFDQVLAKKVLAINLQTRLDEMGVKQNEFAKMIGMSPQHFSFYIRGKRLPSMGNLRKMAKGFGLENPRELYRIPDGIVPKLEQETWNTLIDVFSVGNEEDILKIRDYLKMVLQTSKSKPK